MSLSYHFRLFFLPPKNKFKFEKRIHFRQGNIRDFCVAIYFIISPLYNMGCLSAPAMYRTSLGYSITKKQFLEIRDENITVIIRNIKLQDGLCCNYYYYCFCQN